MTGPHGTIRLQNADPGAADTARGAAPDREGIRMHVQDSRHRCERCNRPAEIVEIRPWVSARVAALQGKDITVHVLCKPHAIEDENSGITGYWFDLPRWFGDGHTMRDHLIESKEDGYFCAELIDEKLSQLRTRATKPHRSRVARRHLSARRRYAVLLRDGFRCQTCGRTAEQDGVRLHVDHQQPLAKGGEDTDDNLWTLCEDCNQGKGAGLCG